MFTVTAPAAEPTPLQKHLAATYFTLRWGLGAIAVVFPLLLVLGGWFYAGLPLQDSMSAYYHAANGDRSMRTWFVGILFALGALLYLYKGYSVRENIALNLTGIMVVLVAVVPMEWECGEACASFSVHGASAILAFLGIAYVSAFCADDTLNLIRDPKRQRRFRETYRALAGLMIVSPAAAFVLGELVGLSSAVVFLVEAFGIFAFAAFWFTKGREIRQTHADLMALDGSLMEAAAPLITSHSESDHATRTGLHR